MVLARNQWQTLGFNSGPLDEGGSLQTCGLSSQKQKNGEAPELAQEAVTAWAWWCREVAGAGEAPSCNCPTCHCQNNSDSGRAVCVLSTPSAPASFLFHFLTCWCCQQKLNREQRSRVITIPGSHPMGGTQRRWRMDLSWQNITNTDM